MNSRPFAPRSLWATAGAQPAAGDPHAGSSSERGLGGAAPTSLASAPALLVKVARAAELLGLSRSQLSRSQVHELIQRQVIPVVSVPFTADRMVSIETLRRLIKQWEQP